MIHKIDEYITKRSDRKYRKKRISHALAVLDMSRGELIEALNLPPSTVHRNLSQYPSKKFIAELAGLLSQNYPKPSDAAARLKRWLTDGFGYCVTLEEDCALMTFRHLCPTGRRIQVRHGVVLAQEIARKQ